METVPPNKSRTMNIRHALVLAVSISLFLIGCTTTPDERHLERLMRHRDWPRIEQIARTEVKKREKIPGIQTWPDTAAYLPQEHIKRIWTVGAMAGDRGGGERIVILTISDEGHVLAYQRFVDGEPLPNTEEPMR
jgi:hypothetical protein